jgi:T5SS/PEP-CTERM-associated repeat protein
MFFCKAFMAVIKSLMSPFYFLMCHKYNASVMMAVSRIHYSMLLLVCFGIGRGVLNAQVTWDGGGGTNTEWNTALNWDGNTVPISTDNVLINGTATHADSSTAAVGVNIDIGTVGTGTLSISNGADLTHTGYLYLGQGGTGTVNLSGAGSSITSGGLFSFRTGTSVLNITDNALLTLNASLNTTGSGTSIINLSSGADIVANTGVFTLGQIAGGTGNLYATGSGTTIQTTAGNVFYVGNLGTGNFSLLDSATLTTGSNLVIGQGASGTGNVTLSGSSTSATIGGQAIIGNDGDATLTMGTGASLASTSNVTLGSKSGSSGVVTISGTGTLLTASNAINIASKGNGTFAMSDGADVNVTNNLTVGMQAGSSGSFSSSGSGTDTTITAGNMTIGSLGTGTFSLSNGSHFTATVGNFGLGVGATGIGTGTLTDNSTLLSVGNVAYVGLANQGTLTINTGADMTVANTLNIGNDSGSNGTLSISDSGSTLTVTSDAYVGVSGTGRLDVSSGATVTATNLIVGHQAGSSGVVKISGSGSTYTSTGNIAIGGTGMGSLNLLDSANIVSGPAFIIGRETGGSGTFHLNSSGSTLTATTLFIGGYNSKATGTFIYDAGTLSLTNAIRIDEGTIKVNSGNSSTISKVLVDNSINTGTTGNFYKTGEGTLTLTAASTYTGDTTLSEGILNLDHTSVSGNILPSTTDLIFKGGTLKVTGKAATVTTQTVNSATVDGGGTVNVVNNGGTSTTLNLNSITHTSGNIALQFDSGSAITVDNTNNASGIIGGWASAYDGTTYGFAYNVTNTADGVVGVKTLSAALTNLTTWDSAADANTLISNTGSDYINALDNNATIGNLAFEANLADNVFVNGHTLIIAQGGILINNGVGANTSTIRGGTIQGESGKGIYISHYGTGSLNIESVIADNTSASGLNYIVSVRKV